MGATIYSFAESRKHAGTKKRAVTPSTIDFLSDITKQEIMRHHDQAPIGILREAVAMASGVLSEGGSVLEAMAEAEVFISRNYTRPRTEKDISALLDLAAVRIRRMVGARDLYHPAMCRVRRVLESGGTLGAAIYRALGYELIESAS